jgi:hypothetical protein
MADSHPAHRRNRLPLIGIIALIAVGLGLVVLFVLGRQGGAQSQGGPSVVYVLDSSSRMQLPAEGGTDETRLEVARAVLAELVRPADPSLISGLRVFGSGAAGDPCRDTDLAVPFSPANHASIIAGLDALTPGTSADAALSTAMVAAIQDLSQRPGPHWLVVVTGGADTCNPDGNRLVADELERSGIELDSFVIGFQMTAEEQAAIQNMMSELPGSTFISAGNSSELQSAVSVLGDRIKSPSDVLAGLGPDASSTLPPTSSALSGPTATLAATVQASGDGIIPGTGCTPPDIFDPLLNQCRPPATSAGATGQPTLAGTIGPIGTRPPFSTPIIRFSLTPTTGKVTATPPIIRSSPTPTVGRTLITRFTHTPE